MRKINLNIDNIIISYVIFEKTIPEITKELGCSYEPITRVLKDCNIKRRRKTINLPKEYTKELYLSGKTTTEIAEEFECSKHAVCNCLNKLNITRRSGSESHINLLIGEKNPRWRGGISFLPYCHKFNKPLKEEIRELFRRKCYICEKTEKENKKRLDVHHCDFNKQQGCKGNLTWKLLPLCKSCHAWTSHHRHEAFALLVNYWVLNPEINFNINF